MNEPRNLRVAVCGGRVYRDRDTVFGALDRCLSLFSIRELIHGGSDGADALAAERAQARGVPCVCVKAEWDKYGKKAGPIRNDRMMDMRPDVLVAFPGGKGLGPAQRAADSVDPPCLGACQQ